jgi:hypothetical protein
LSVARRLGGGSLKVKFKVGILVIRYAVGLSASGFRREHMQVFKEQNSLNHHKGSTLEKSIAASFALVVNIQDWKQVGC